MKIIEFKNTNKTYDGKFVLQDFSYQFEEGEHYCISGHSGIGKTTLFRLLLGLETADSGEIILHENISFSPVFQENRLCDTLTVQKNLELVLPAPNTSAILEGLKALQLLGTEKQLITELSGGMKRRVSILRAVLHGGSVFIMDEPFKELDSATKEITMRYVAKNAQNKTLVWITHDLSELEFLPSHLVKL